MVQTNTTMQREFLKFLLIGFLFHVVSTSDFLECPITYKPTREYCKKERLADTTEARKWFKITTKNSTIGFPLARKIPWLDQTVDDVIFHYTMDPFESRNLLLLSTWNSTMMEKIAPAIIAKFSKAKYETNKDFADFHSAMQTAIKVSIPPVNPVLLAKF